eukprot:TRINITY_DN14223_c0_g1_i2.p1 TRINITY_DN14223_c0_g1~~TRINITY_DN14223_c0_g1_i2.p1  ORF type:complete len:1781 (-),score=443.15 TRINITY_DN14223_c0_g1_i2:1294-6636(-)
MPHAGDEPECVEDDKDDESSINGEQAQEEHDSEHNGDAALISVLRSVGQGEGGPVVHPSRLDQLRALLHVQEQQKVVYKEPWEDISRQLLQLLMGVPSFAAMLEPLPLRARIAAVQTLTPEAFEPGVTVLHEMEDAAGLILHGDCATYLIGDETHTEHYQEHFFHGHEIHGKDLDPARIPEHLAMNWSELLHVEMSAVEEGAEVVLLRQKVLAQALAMQRTKDALRQKATSVMRSSEPWYREKVQLEAVSDHLLANVSSFQGMSAQAVQDVCQHATHVQVHPGDYLVQAGAPVDGLRIILSGRLLYKSPWSHPWVPPVMLQEAGDAENAAFSYARRTLVAHMVPNQESLLTAAPKPIPPYEELGEDDVLGETELCLLPRHLDEASLSAVDEKRLFAANVQAATACEVMFVPKHMYLKVMFALRRDQALRNGALFSLIGAAEIERAKQAAEQEAAALEGSDDEDAAELEDGESATEATPTSASAGGEKTFSRRGTRNAPSSVACLSQSSASDSSLAGTGASQSADVSPKHGGSVRKWTSDAESHEGPTGGFLADITEDSGDSASRARALVLDFLLTSYKDTGLALLRQFPLRARRQLCGRAKLWRAYKGEVLFQEGAPADAIFVLLRGRVGLFRRDGVDMEARRDAVMRKLMSKVPVIVKQKLQQCQASRASSAFRQSVMGDCFASALSTMLLHDESALDTIDPAELELLADCVADLMMRHGISHSVKQLGVLPDPHVMRLFLSCSEVESMFPDFDDEAFVSETVVDAALLGLLEQVLTDGAVLGFAAPGVNSDVPSRKHTACVLDPVADILVLEHEAVVALQREVSAKLVKGSTAIDVLTKPMAEPRTPYDLYVLEAVVRQHQAFAEVESCTLAELCRAMKLVTVPKGEFMCREDEAVTGFFQILRGQAGVYVSRQAADLAFQQPTDASALSGGLEAASEKWHIEGDLSRDEIDEEEKQRSLDAERAALQRLVWSQQEDGLEIEAEGVEEAEAVLLLAVGEGQAFGEEALLGESSLWLQSVQAQEQVEILWLDLEKYQELTRAWLGEQAGRRRAVEVLRSTRPLEEERLAQLQALEGILAALPDVQKRPASMRQRLSTELAKRVEYSHVQKGELLAEDVVVDSVCIVLSGCIGRYTTADEGSPSGSSRAPRGKLLMPMLGEASDASHEDVDVSSLASLRKKLEGLRSSEEALAAKVERSPLLTPLADTLKLQAVRKKLAVLQADLRQLEAAEAEEKQRAAKLFSPQHSDALMSPGSGQTSKQSLNKSATASTTLLGTSVNTAATSSDADRQGSAFKFLTDVGSITEYAGEGKFSCEFADEFPGICKLCSRAFREGDTFGDLEGEDGSFEYRAHTDSDVLLISQQVFKDALKTVERLTNKERAAFLRRYLPPTVQTASIEQLVPHLYEETKPRGSVLVREKALASTIWLIAKGCCQAVVNGQLSDAADLGAASLPPQSARSARPRLEGGAQFMAASSLGMRAATAGSATRPAPQKQPTTLGVLGEGHFIGLNSVVLRQAEEMSVVVISPEVELLMLQAPQNKQSVLIERCFEPLRESLCVKNDWYQQRSLRVAALPGQVSERLEKVRSEVQQAEIPLLMDSPFLRRGLGLELPGFDRHRRVCEHFGALVHPESEWMFGAQDRSFYHHLQMSSLPQNSYHHLQMSSLAPDSDGEGSANQRFTRWQNLSTPAPKTPRQLQAGSRIDHAAAMTAAAEAEARKYLPPASAPARAEATALPYSLKTKRPHTGATTAARMLPASEAAELQEVLPAPFDSYVLTNHGT